MKLYKEELLTLDFWQDNVIYCGKPMPTGALACAVLNFSDELIGKLKALCNPLNQFMGAINRCDATTEQMLAARESVLQIIALLRALPPFDNLNEQGVREYMSIPALYSQGYLDNLLEYAKTGDERNEILPEYSKGATLLRALRVMAHMGYSFDQYKKRLIPFAEKLHDCDRTVEGYAAIFGQIFPPAPDFDESKAEWMSEVNTTIQYISSIVPGKDAAQLVKQMHFITFVSMFRTDLFEGLCVGHAPRKCPICGRWFLTTNARRTKYCDGLTPGDKFGRTCRQIGNIRGRAQRELAGDHPLKRLYKVRTNTIDQRLHRGMIAEETANAAKRLAKNKLEHAISNRTYALGAYKTEMETDALLAEAKKLLNKRRR